MGFSHYIIHNGTPVSYSPFGQELLRAHLRPALLPVQTWGAEAKNRRKLQSLCDVNWGEKTRSKTRSKRGPNHGPQLRHMELGSVGDTFSSAHLFLCSYACTSTQVHNVGAAKPNSQRCQTYWDSNPKHNLNAASPLRSTWDSKIATYPKHKLNAASPRLPQKPSPKLISRFLGFRHDLGS